MSINERVCEIINFFIFDRNSFCANGVLANQLDAQGGICVKDEATALVEIMNLERGASFRTDIHEFG